MSKIAQYTFDDLELGMTAQMTHTVTNSDIHKFSGLTKDTHPLHTSEEYAKAHGFDTIIAHGLLISSYSSGIVGLSLPGENAIIVSQEFRYRKPLYPQTTIVVNGKIIELDERFKTIKVEVKIMNIQDNSLLASGSYKVKLRN